MQKVILKSKSDAMQKNLLANWEFARDSIMSPKGIDVTPVSTIAYRQRTLLSDKQPVEVSQVVGDTVHVYTTTQGKLNELLKTLCE